MISATPALLAVTVSPANPTVREGATQQFTASTPSTWSTTCGTISTTGSYKAPLYPKTCSVTAKANSGSGSATTNVNIVSPFAISPASATTPQGRTQQFTASIPVKWSAKCGSITAGGLYTASGAVGAYCTITAVATSGPAYTAYSYDHIAPVTSLKLSISPLSPALQEGASLQFTSTVPASWSATCGAINTSTGLYTAPLAPGSCTVTAAATNGSGQTASTIATVTSPVTITPAAARTPQGATQQFTANAAVTWSATCGAITQGGLFTASAALNASCTIQVVAASGPAYTAFATDTVVSGSLTISPLTPTLTEGAAQQFTASGSATWSATCGSIDSNSGLYTAPLAPGACTITASNSGGQSATTLATITAPFAVSPATTSTPANGTQQFTTNPTVAATWTTSCGSINNSGLFTAPATKGSNCTITATETGGPAYTATATDTIGTAAVLSISPLSPSLSEGASQTFSANVPVTWAASCGAIDSASGVFTAPFTAGSCKVTATATDSSAQTASTQISITSPITITPSTVAMHAIGQQQFSADTPVTWAASCGAVDANSGLYTAPANAGGCTVTATAASGPAYTAQARASVTVVNFPRWRNNAAGIGLQPDELTLTPANVNSAHFGLNWTASVDGWVTAEPLYMNAVMINGARHNAVFVATANDSVYAFDGDTGAQLWQMTLLTSGATAVTGSTIDEGDMPLVGVLGTPVIDPATNTLYLVAETAEQNNTYFPHRLHALDLTTGNERPQSPVLITDPNLPPVHILQRPGLLLANGNIYVAFGSIQDLQPYHGFLFSFDAQSLVQNGLWISTPTGAEGGIWQSGAPPAVDENGNLYVTTGNGTFDGTNNFGESAVKLSPSLQLLDYFTPYNYDYYDSIDFDLGSGSVVVVPTQSGQHPHELIVCGKPTPIYLLNRDSMGHVGGSSNNVIQAVDNQLGSPDSSNLVKTCYTTPAIWGQNIYFTARNDALKMFTLDPNTGLLSNAPVSQDTFAYGYPGSEPVVSANGSTNGIVWTIDPRGTLRANDASNVSALLYSGSLSGGGIKWTVPTVVNGHVYVGERGTVFAFGSK